MQVLLDMLLSWKRNGRQHNCTHRISKSEEICTVKKARVLKCSAAAHLIGLFIPSYTCTLEKIWGSQRKGMKATQQAFFILIFMRGGQRNQLLQVSVKFWQGTPLGISPSKGRARATIPDSSQVSTHLAPHTPQHMPTVRCKPWEKKQGLWRTWDLQKALPCSQNSCFYLWIWAKRPLLPNQVQPPCCSITAVNLLIAFFGMLKVRNLHEKMTRKASLVGHKHRH